MRNILFALAILSLFGCKTSKPKTIEVGHQGALMSIMHQGDISAKASLHDFKHQSHLYALGALENLKGEIQILDSDPFISSEQDSQLAISRSFDNKATLLVYATVEAWTLHEMPDSVSTYGQLEKYVEEAARHAGLETEKAFPFLITGTVYSAKWHVINWPEGDTIHTHEKHKASGLDGTVRDQPVTLLGFFSKHHQGIFTHHSTFMHVHIITDDYTVAGHLDGVILGPGMMLKLPKVK